LVKATAQSLGFFYCGITEAVELSTEKKQLEQYLIAGRHGEMHWLAQHFDLRTDPRMLVPGAKSMVMLGYHYHNPEALSRKPNTIKISRYAFGRDYHKVVKKKLKHFMAVLQEEIGDIEGRAFVDSAPVMEKVWAARTGMGWQGKHTNIIHPQQGSWFFLAELILDIPLLGDGSIKDYCGTCTACIDACPTDALQPYKIDASRCISYLTIELKASIDTQLAAKWNDWAFGCDICQEVCPWNRFAIAHTEPDFQWNRTEKERSAREWLEISEEIFDAVFVGSAVKRAGYGKFMQTIKDLSRFKTDNPK
jgi:epoxyqueuosine reductase